MILGLHHVHAELRVGMERVGRILVRLDVFHRRFVVLDDLAVLRWEKAHEVNFCVCIVHRHANLADVSLTQYIREDHWMLVDHTVFVRPAFHESIRDLVKVEFLNVIRESARAVLNRPATIGGVLMENLQMRRVHGILHRLKPIAVELRLNEDFPVTILTKPNIEVWDQRQRLWAQVGPVKTD